MTGRDNVGVPPGDGLGARVRAARTARGLSREAVAALCGRSEEWLRLIERGKRGTSLRMLAKLADVLRVRDLGELLGEHAPAAVYVRPEHPALGEIRRAVVAFGPVAEDMAPSPADLRARVRYAWRRRSASHRDRTDLAAVLPGLMVDAQRAARAGRSPAERRTAHRVLAEVYHLGQLYLCYQDAAELLWVVVDRAMAAAVESDSPAAVGRAAWFSAYLYRDFGQLDQAHQVVDDALRHLRGAPEQTGELLRQRSTVHLAEAWNHARESRSALAWRAWDAAVDARRESGLPDPPDALFGATVEDVALTLDVELGKATSAARRAEAVDIGAVASTPRRARLAIEASRGLMLRRDYTGAVYLLRRAYETSPEATLFSMHARAMAAELLGRTGPLLRGDVADLADKLGVAA